MSKLSPKKVDYKQSYTKNQVEIDKSYKKINLCKKKD